MDFCQKKLVATVIAILSCTCDKFQKGIREIVLSFQGGLLEMYRIYRKTLNSDQRVFQILVKSCMF